ncbi:unnamed protein product [Onchocerca flexuosa]|uniref:Uncharacterized protein n=1 Tax=Onchocerca flexuosa TaxID=387005 RepID=A0A183I4B2_9BILA|nr:unnamed protein product [Onchocerca flexuosa]
MFHEERSKINDVKKEKYSDGDSVKMERSNIDNTEEIPKKLKINESGGTEMKEESIERNDENEEKELAREDVCS